MTMRDIEHNRAFQTLSSDEVEEVSGAGRWVYYDGGVDGGIEWSRCVYVD